MIKNEHASDEWFPTVSRTFSEETLLFDRNLEYLVVFGDFSNSQNGKTHLPRPPKHEARYVFTTGLGKSDPKVVGCGVPVLVALDVQLQAPLEYLSTTEIRFINLIRGNDFRFNKTDVIAT